jgi:hypothetical protein
MTRDLATEASRWQRNGHTLELHGCMWRCLQCGHRFDAAVDADLFWCGEDCTGRHPGDLAASDDRHHTRTHHQPEETK